MPEIPRPRRSADEPMPYGQRYALLRLAGEPVPMGPPTTVTWRALERRGYVAEAPGTTYGYELTGEGRRILHDVRVSLEPLRRRGGRR
jgi:hypothetical protein